MGSVHVVEQRSTGKRRALKVMHPQLVRDPRNRARFLQEARLGARLESDHVVDVVAAGVDDASGTPWLAMELLQGEDLAAALARRGCFAPGEVLELLRQLCHALSAAHRLGIVHRDVKPENVFLAVGRRSDVAFTVKVLDFGIAKVLEEAGASRSTTGVLGSPMFMAPEQANALAASPATDVWALGLLAFNLLLGRSYWRSVDAPGSTLQGLLVELLVEPLEPASARALAFGLAERLPPGFDAWFARCVHRDPSQRFQSAQEALDGTHGWWAGAAAPPLAPPTRAPPTPMPRTVAWTVEPPDPRTPTRPRGARWVPAALGLGGFLLAGTAFAGLWKLRATREEDPAPHPVTPVAVPEAAPRAPASPTPTPCEAPRHTSGGHCCNPGEAWVPDRGACVCLDPQVCAPLPQESTQAPRPAARPSARPPAPRAALREPWRSPEPPPPPPPAPARTPPRSGLRDPWGGQEPSPPPPPPPPQPAAPPAVYAPHPQGPAGGSGYQGPASPSSGPVVGTPVY